MNFINFLKDVFAWIFSHIVSAARFLAEKFIELGFFSKLLCFTLLLSFLAVVKPSARYYIFESWYYINNPLSENLIGLVLLAVIGFFVRPLFALILRLIPSAVYFIWVIYLQASHSISKAPYELLFWHYLNVIVPLLIAAVSCAVYFSGEDS